ncbi:NCS2 family permease [Spirulina sp. CS-785/01]|uniref:NCS2 family permease n=1 Tax=Spirulina sp. CS-785/01 TaxID=3021716 RepID=UPI00233158A1|nr:NCS2 family permease [Spirulina sp. CS-785/01]MDB9315017.1 NCS2 family permease [Spirulina sp. CS-785/01]
MTHDTDNPQPPETPTPPNRGATHPIAQYFNFTALQTDFRREILAGITTFVTMAYILVANPGILSNAIFLEEAGDLFGELVIATGVSAAIATLIMGLYAKFPFALAPGMGLNAYFAFTVVLGLGIDWRAALAAVFVEGIVFILLTLSNLRTIIVQIIPDAIKHATAAGIGLFIAYIALSGSPETGGAGIILASEATTTTLGDLGNPNTLMAIAGIFITAAFVVRRIQGALLWGILATAILGWLLQISPPPQGLLALPTPPVDLVGQAFVGLGNLLTTNVWQLFSILFVFLFVDLFDTVGTVTGLGVKAGYIQDDGKFPGVNRAFLADSVGTTTGAIFGTSTVTTYIESASGISEGGRSGFTAVVTAVLFLIALLFIPLFEAIPGYATAPALIVVGVLMAGSVKSIRWDDPAESIPAFLTIIIMPLSYSIADGLAAGLITYPIIKAMQGKAQEVNLGMWVLALLFILKFWLA